MPAYVDGRMLGIAEAAGARLINRDRMWHYVEGVRNWDPIWPEHGIRILPGPSSLWLDATGRRLPRPALSGLRHARQPRSPRQSGHDHSWFILTQSIIAREFALSGSEQNPDLTGRDWRLVLGRVGGRKATGPVEAFKRHGEDFVVRADLDSLVDGMNALSGTALLDAAEVRLQVEARDREIANPFTKDGQVMGIRNARRYLGDRLVRTARPHTLLDPAHGPLIAVRLHILTRKTLGGLETDLDGRVFGHDLSVIPGLHAVGEAAGFGGGGMHGFRALEGAFLGGCLFTGRQAGRAVARIV